MMLIASYLFFGCFTLSSLCHLYFCFEEKETLRKITKPLCLFFLFLAYLFYKPRDYFVYTGLILAFIGDIILLFNKKAFCFIIGTFIFAFSHIFYLIQFNQILDSPLPYYVFLIAVALIFIISLITYKITLGIMKDKRVSLIGNYYILFLFSMVLMSLYVAIMGKVSTGLFALFAYLFFVFSDIFLANTTFKKDVKRRDFYIMLSYLLGEAFIVLGFIFII